MVLHLPTFQYAALAAVWFVSKHHLLKLTPYTVYSLLQSAEYASRKLIKDEETKQKVDDFLSHNALKLERLVADSNILLFLRLVLDVLTIRPGSGVSLIAYIFYFRLSMENAQTKRALENLEEKIDSVIEGNSKVPAKVKDIWKKIKWSVDHRESYALTPEEKRAQEERLSEAKKLNEKESKVNEQELSKKKSVPELEHDDQTNSISKANGEASDGANNSKETTPSVPDIRVDDSHVNGIAAAQGDAQQAQLAQQVNGS